MDYSFLNNSIEKDNIILPESSKIDSFLLKNNQTEIIKAIEFIASEEKFLYVHGFMGTGKRQFINYICDFLHKDVIKLELYCKESTVCDDLLLAFNEIIDNHNLSKAVNLNTKITTLNVKFQQLIASIKKPFIIILHSFDDIQKENTQLIIETLNQFAANKNTKIIISTKAMIPAVLGDLEEDRKIFLKAFSKDIFKEFLSFNSIELKDKTVEDFYKYSRGYYYYAALTIKILQAMKIDLNEFLQKFNKSEMDFDSYLGLTYLNVIPTAIRNFFWFLRTVRHGLTLNSLAIFELYDEFAIQYLKNNLIIFQSGETLYVHDFFTQKIDLSIPEKTQVKLHKYIINIYENLLKMQIKDRALLISRQTLRAEIEYHNNCISKIENGEPIENSSLQDTTKTTTAKELELTSTTSPEDVLSSKISAAIALSNEKKYTEAIEAFHNILDSDGINLITVVEIRTNLARLYKQINEYQKASYYFELVETYYKQHKEIHNLNYLYYDMTDLYYKMYKNNRAIETIKKVIYSVDTPQSLMVNSCTLLGNIYSDINNPEEAFTYYHKALESLDNNVNPQTLAELYFKYALANDDKGDITKAFEYYNKCITINNSPYKALAYSNMASCYYDNDNITEAKECFIRAYDLEKMNNNYDGIYYNSSKLAQIFIQEGRKDALEYLIEAKKTAEFINEEFYILEASLALGDYYYNNPKTYKEALVEYLIAKNISEHISGDYSKIDNRISDMRLRMSTTEFIEIENKYAK